MSCHLRRTRRAIRAAITAAVLLASAPGGGDAQDLVGRILLDGQGVAGQEIVIHRVTRDSAGVVGQTVSATDGSFNFSLPPADTAGFTVYFGTVEYLGVRYFGYPIHPGEPLEGYPIQVFDTVSVGSPMAPPLRLARRDVVLLPETDGGWEVNEVIQLVNPGDRTLVSREGLATWEFPIPSGATAFELGEGEVAASEIVRVDDSALLLVPLLPGPREIFVRYRIPASRREIRLDVGTQADSLKVFVQRPSPEVQVSGMEVRSPVRTEAGEFLSFAAADLPGDASVTVSWTGPWAPPVSPTVAAIAILVGFLAAGIIGALISRRAAPPGGTAERSAGPRAPRARRTRPTEPVG